MVHQPLELHYHGKKSDKRQNMNLQITSNTDKVDIRANSLYPSLMPTPRTIWYKNQIVRFEIQKNDVGYVYIDVLMVGTTTWQLDNEGHGLGLPVSTINGTDVSAMSNNELMDMLYTL